MSELRQGDGPRPSEDRIGEATSLAGVDVFVVACPKDVTMYEDAIKTSGHAGEIQLREVTELLLESLELEAVGIAPDADANPREPEEGA
jgi:Fe-S oxidoreductase